MSKPRRAGLEVLYNKTNISSQISEFIEDFSYTDATNKSDCISLTVDNKDGRWTNEWMPDKCSQIVANIITTNWETEGIGKSYNCGTFTIDDIAASSSPSVCSIGAVSMPVQDGFSNTKRTKTWENITILGIVQEIATRYGLEAPYGALRIAINSIEQSEQTDSAFLATLCKDYGLSIKVYSNRVYIYDEGLMEDLSSVTTIYKGDITRWDYNTTLTGTYTGAKISYSNPNSDEDITITVGDSTRLLEINEKVDNLEDAEIRAVTRVNIANREMTTMNIRIMANPNITATNLIMISGLGKVDGKYFINKIKHNVTKSGYTMDLNIRKVQKRLVVNKRVQADGTNYTIKAGDTLWMLAKQYYGSGAQYTKIIDANRELLDSVAQQRGLVNSSNGHWIFPGTTITIP